MITTEEVAVANVDGQPDHALVPATTVGISPKTIAAGAWAFAAPLLLAGLDALLAYLLDNPSVFASLPAVVQVPLLAALAALAGSTGAWKASPGVVVPGTVPERSQGL